MCEIKEAKQAAENLLWKATDAEKLELLAALIGWADSEEGVEFRSTTEHGEATIVHTAADILDMLPTKQREEIENELVNLG